MRGLSWSRLLVWGWLPVSLQSERPKDIWDTNIWGGLPPLEEDTAGIEIAQFKPIITKHRLRRDTTAEAFPNPCTDPNFQEPRFEAFDWNLTKTFLDSTKDFPVRIDFAVKFRDTVNNYTLNCGGEPHELSPPWDYWHFRCAPEGGFQDGRLEQFVSLQVFPSAFYRGSGNAGLTLKQFWGCKDPGIGTYPRVLMSYPEAISYTVSCPGQNSTNTGIPLPCNMSAPVFKSSLTRWNTTQPPPITPRPVVEPVEEKPVLAPTQDCTTLSFARPDVILEGGALYTPNSPGGSLTDTYLNFTITNRATGVHHFCRWGGNHTQLESGSWLRLLCALPPGSLPDPTSTSFSIVFVPNERRLRITQDWACGSTDGSYTRKYQSFVTHVPPFVCPSSPGGQATTCVANRQYIKAQLQRPVQWSPDLIPPPASALHPGCTGNSQIPSWVIHKFRYEDERAIFWFAEDPNPLPPISQWPFGPYYPWDPSRTITLEIRNQANNNLQTCQLRSFSRTETDAQFARRWHRCHPDTGNSIHYIETYVQFDPSTANFRVNETWFCGDTDPSKPILYTSLAATKIPTCGTSTTEITRCPEWERGPQFTPNCSWHYHTRFCQTGKFESGQSGPIIVPADHFFSSSPEQTQTRLLPSNALTDPDPNPDLWSCTSDSLGRPITWTLNETPDHLGFADFFSTQLSWGTDISDPRSTLDFEFVNSALQKRDSGEGGKNKIMLWTSSNLTPYTPLWRPDLKYGLFVKEYSSSLVVQGHGRKPFREFLDWNLKFDASRGYFEIEHAWVCGELNGGRPILFNGTWAGYLNVTCDFTEAERRDEARVVCRLAGGSAVLKPKVTWEVRPGLVIT